MKHRILTNIKDNINDHCMEDTFYYCWSALDLSDKLSIEERCIKMKDLLTILCTEKVHTIKRCKSKKEDDVEPDLWNEYKISSLRTAVLFLDFSL